MSNLRRPLMWAFVAPLLMLGAALAGDGVRSVFNPPPLSASHPCPHERCYDRWLDDDTCGPASENDSYCSWPEKGVCKQKACNH